MGERGGEGRPPRASGEEGEAVLGQNTGRQVVRYGRRAGGGVPGFLRRRESRLRDGGRETAPQPDGDRPWRDPMRHRGRRHGVCLRFDPRARGVVQHAGAQDQLPASRVRGKTDRDCAGGAPGKDGRDGGVRGGQRGREDGGAGLFHLLRPAGRGGNRTMKGKVACLVTFAVSMAFVEAAVVVYLREIIGEGPIFPMKEIPPALLAVEVGREGATIVMLVSVAILSVRGGLRRMGAFLLTFAVWDIFYYLWLFVTIDWPAGIGDWDVLFHVPDLRQLLLHSEDLVHLLLVL